MENFDKYKKFNTLNTAEHIAEDFTKAHEEVRSAKEQAESALVRRIGFRGMTDKQMQAEDKVLNLEAAYQGIQENIRSEAEKYAEGYTEYTARLAEMSALLGIQTEPSSMDQFIEQVDRSIGDERDIHGGSFQDYSIELYSFHASPEARKRSIDRVILGDLLTERVPVGTVINLEKGRGAIATNEESRRPRKGMDRKAAIAFAREHGAPSIMEIHSVMREAWVHSNNSHYFGNTEAYIPLTKEVADLMTDDPKGNHMLPDRFAQNYYAHPIFYREDAGHGKGRYMTFNTSFDVQSLAQYEAEANPVSVTLKIGESQFPVKGSSAEMVIETLMKETIRDFSGTERVSEFDKLKRLQEARVLLPDGREVTLMDLTPELLGEARVPEAA
ncbi:MAG: hypothetical protein KBD06_00530 [Candidatus Pacebacteria bacterium]|nr:hypothetical protein [Candidatus Paceibacterota bacterium]